MKFIFKNIECKNISGDYIDENGDIKTKGIEFSITNYDNNFEFITIGVEGEIFLRVKCPICKNYHNYRL